MPFGPLAFGFDLLAFGYVAYHASEHPPPGYNHLTDCKLDRKNRTVLALSRDFASASNHLGLTRSQVSSQVAIVLTAVRLWHQHLDIAPNDFFRAIAKDARRSRIQVLDCSLVVDGYDRFLDRVEDRAHHGRVPAPLCEHRRKEECTECDAEYPCLGSPNTGLCHGTKFAEITKVEGDCTNDRERNHEYRSRSEDKPATRRKPHEQRE